MIKAAGNAWNDSVVQTKPANHRGCSAQRILVLVGRCRIFPVTLSCGRATFEEKEKLVFQTETIQTEAPDSGKVLIMFSLVSKDMVNGLLKSSFHSELQDGKKSTFLSRRAFSKRSLFGRHRATRQTCLHRG